MWTCFLSIPAIPDDDDIYICLFEKKKMQPNRGPNLRSHTAVEVTSLQLPKQK